LGEAAAEDGHNRAKRDKKHVLAGQPHIRIGMPPPQHLLATAETLLNVRTGSIHSGKYVSPGGH
jgi:hypothetical protein